MTSLWIEAPTDAQLSYLAKLADEARVPMPVVYSKQDASLTISELRAGTYRPPVQDEDVPA